MRGSMRRLLCRVSCHQQHSPHQATRHLSTGSPFFRVSDEVAQAVAEKRPVVALESTIYTHGFPYPDNIALASHLESVVRANGGVPATIGILDGIARVGLTAEELIRLAGSAGKPETLKISRRDLAFACALGSPGRRLNGGTTIAGTMVLAQLAGVKVFATGGLGGVHRGAENSMDISADLTELGRTPVAVISSGCKSFLDIPRTLEYLETEGVPVATFADGRDGKVDFPAFWSRDSGTPSPMILQDEATAAAVIYAQHSFGLRTGLLFANPIPEAFSIPKSEMDSIIADALREADDAGISGAANTPFILAKIKDLSGSRSIPANRALIEANVKRGTLVAMELMKLEMDDERATLPKPVIPSQVIVGPGSSNYTVSGTSKAGSKVQQGLHLDIPSSLASSDSNQIKPASVFVAGALAVDFSCDYSPKLATAGNSPAPHTSNPAEIRQSLGGVAHNVARAAHLMGGTVRLISAVGDDLSGKAALEALSSEGLDKSGIKTLPGARTAQYVAVNDAVKDLQLAMADMEILEDVKKDVRKGTGQSATPVAETFRDYWLPQLKEARPTQIVLDANWQPELLALWLEAAKSLSAHVAFEPVSNAKAVGIFHLPPSSQLATFPKSTINLATPNSFELEAMHSAARSLGLFDRQDWWVVVDSLGIPSTGARTQLALATSSAMVDAGIPQQSLQLLPFIPCILVKLGAEGVLLTQLLPAGDDRLSSAECAPYILSRCANGSEENLGVGGVYMRLFPPVERVAESEIVSVNGVGDTFLGTIVAGLEKRGRGARVEDLVDIAQQAAVLTLKSKESVSPELETLRSLL